MNKIFIVAAAVVFLAAACNTQNISKYNEAQLVIAGKRLNIEIVETPEEQSRGLSGRVGLEQNQGMLFTYPSPNRPTFWMKDMLFPIDIIWVNDNKVVDLSLDLKPEPGKQDYQLQLYSPKSDVDMVVEVSSGWAQRNNISIGDEVDLQ